MNVGGIGMSNKSLTENTHRITFEMSYNLLIKVHWISNFQLFEIFELILLITRILWKRETKDIVESKED